MGVLTQRAVLLVIADSRVYRVLQRGEAELAEILKRSCRIQQDGRDVVRPELLYFSLRSLREAHGVHHGGVEFFDRDVSA